MSTTTVQNYVSYLQTDEIVASFHRLNRKLLTPRVKFSTPRRRLLEAIRRDLLDELDRRQLMLPIDGSGQVIPQEVAADVSGPVVA